MSRLLYGFLDMPAAGKDCFTVRVQHGWLSARAGKRNASVDGFSLPGERWSPLIHRQWLIIGMDDAGGDTGEIIITATNLPVDILHCLTFQKWNSLFQQQCSLITKINMCLNWRHCLQFEFSGYKAYDTSEARMVFVRDLTMSAICLPTSKYVKW